MTEAFLNYFECSFIHIGVQVVSQPSDFRMQEVKQQGEMASVEREARLSFSHDLGGQQF